MSSARISPRRGLAGSDRGGDELAGESIVNMERHQAVFVFMGVEEQQLLHTMTMNRCRVHGDDNGLGMGGKRLKENLARRVANANQFFAVQNRFSRRLMVGWEATRDFADRSQKGRIKAEMVAVVCVFIALANLEYTLADEFGQEVFNVRLVTCIMDAFCYF